MAHAYIEMLIEGDEFYTKVHQNLPPEESKGWTIVLMDRAIGILHMGTKVVYTLCRRLGCAGANVG